MIPLTCIRIAIKISFPAKYNLVKATVLTILTTAQKN